MTDPRFEIARLLLLQDDETLAGEALLRKTMAFTGADRGYVVAKDADQFKTTFAARFDAAGDGAEARFSRSLVRAALAQNEIVHSRNPAEDPDLARLESLAVASGRAVLVVPLSSGETRFGAIYLEHPEAGGFTGESIQLVADISELAGLCLHGAVKRSGFRKRNAVLERELFAQYDFGGIVTRDPGMLSLLKTVAQVAASKASILVTGESGTGKELIAKAIHVNSDRAKGPLVNLHCAALPSTMIESELFGHVRGAFTGADRERAGRLASAHGGTLFLDEVAEIPLETQAKLLRALQFGEIQRLGSDKLEKTDVRVVAATHGDLAGRVARGTFRQDLYYRLRVVELKIPALRERAGDVGLLAHHFVKQLRPGARLRASVIGALERYGWPGNVRELMHAMERATLLSTDDEIGTELLPEEIRMAARDTTPRASPQKTSNEPRFSTFAKSELEDAIEASAFVIEREFVEGLLALHGGNISKAASESGIHRSHLQRLIARARPTP